MVLVGYWKLSHLVAICSSQYKVSRIEHGSVGCTHNLGILYLCADGVLEQEHPNGVELEA
jgi:hypothetical protein